MSFEEKYKNALKRYKEAFEKAKITYDTGDYKGIKKAIKKALRVKCCDTLDEALVWIEKQGEQKSAEKWDDTAIAKLADEYEEALRKESNMSENMASHCRLAFFHGANVMLEKLKDEQKSVEPKTTGYWNVQDTDDNVKPKFKVGDWIVDKNGTVQQILSYKNGIYKHTNGYSSKMFEDVWRLWDITKDAKEGDVILDGNYPFIFKKTKYNSKHCYAFCGIGQDGNFMVNPYDWYGKEDSSEVWTWGSYLKPATKEQRDLLFQKMKEAGYEWDSEKKEIKKTEQESSYNNDVDNNSVVPFNIEHGKFYYCINDYFSGGNKRASRGDVIQALRGMSMMALNSEEAAKYFLPVNNIVYSSFKCDCKKMKSYTDLEQSKKLAEILPFESADMWYHGYSSPLESERKYDNEPCPFHSMSPNWDKPCWSLAALLGVLPFHLIINNQRYAFSMYKGLNKDGETYMLRYNVFNTNVCLYLTDYYNNPIDACYEMIIRLNEPKML